MKSEFGKSIPTHSSAAGSLLLLSLAWLALARCTSDGAVTPLPRSPETPESEPVRAGGGEIPPDADVPVPAAIEPGPERVAAVNAPDSTPAAPLAPAGPAPEGTLSILDLQPFRTIEDRPLPPVSGFSRIEWINLNPRINRWFVLRLSLPNGEVRAYHLENIGPRRQQVHLSPDDPAELRITSQEEYLDCSLLEERPGGSLTRAAASSEIYVPLCDGKLYLRNPTRGNKTSVEWATDFLRNYVWGGEQITVLVRETFFNDAYLSTSAVIPGEPAGSNPRPRPAGAPRRPRINPAYDGQYLTAEDLGIRVEGDAGNRMLVGRWYQALDLKGIFVSVVQPGLVADVDPELAGRTRVNQLDETETSAQVYLVAFDLGQYDLEYALGTDHPALSWSTRIPDAMLDAALPGPDGIAGSQPLVRTGKVSPAAASQVTASFIGGFKRYHGAFRYGAFSQRNHGTHYGFIESGTVFSRLQPGLATLLVMEDGSVEMKTWTDRDNSDLPRIRHARQNGLALIEPDAATGTPRPGSLVSEPKLGNWSGSVEGLYRTVRSGVCLQQEEDRQFLIYGFFSAATAGTLARVFHAYDCNFAMLLDINALEHTYLAIYRPAATGLAVEELHQGMRVLEKTSRGQIIPRFVGYADNRDFFYLLRRPNP